MIYSIWVKRMRLERKHYRRARGACKTRIGRINAFSVFLCWMVIERLRSGAFTEADQGYKLSIKTTNMATRAADCHSKTYSGGRSPRSPFWLHLLLYFFILSFSLFYLFNHISVSPTSLSHISNFLLIISLLSSPFISPLSLGR